MIKRSEFLNGSRKSNNEKPLKQFSFDTCQNNNYIYVDIITV